MKSSQSRMKKRRKSRYHNRGFGLMLGIILIGLLCAWMVNQIKVNVSDLTYVTVGLGENYRTNVKAEWLGFDITHWGEFEGNVDTSKPGSYYTTYRPPLSFKEYSVIVIVEDKVAPVISLYGGDEVFVDYIEAYTEPGYSAYDNYDGNITSWVQKGRMYQTGDTYTIDYFVEDSSGNLSVATRTIRAKKGVVYLTFDDGPSHDTTPQILDILKAKGVKATFFVVGFGENKEYLIERLYDEGHTIAYHGYSHDYAKVYKSVDSVMENFYEIEDKVLEVTGGESTKLVRFPGGSSNTVSKKYCLGVVTEAAKRLTEENYVYFDWNVDSEDAGGARTAEEVYQNVIKNIKPGRNVVLMHDFSGNQKTVDALAAIIDFCTWNNYEIRVLDKDVQAIHHNIAN